MKKSIVGLLIAIIATTGCKKETGMSTTSTVYPLVVAMDNVSPTMLITFSIVNPSKTDTLKIWEIGYEQGATPNDSFILNKPMMVCLESYVIYDGTTGSASGLYVYVDGLHIPPGQYVTISMITKIPFEKKNIGSERSWSITSLHYQWNNTDHRISTETSGKLMGLPITARF